MRIESPLSNLRSLLSQLKDSAGSYKGTLVGNEAATRAVLIDPVLRALGWDTANTYMVEVEKTAPGVQADYALYDSNGAVVNVVEAKKLAQPLSPFQNDVTKYAYAFGVGSVFLTDGVEWRHYTDFRPQSFAPTRTLNIVMDDLGDMAAYLVQELDAAKFWPEEADVDVLAQQLAQLRSDFASLQQMVLAQKAAAPSGPLSQNRPPAMGPPHNPVPPPPPASAFVPLRSVGSVKGKTPSWVRLPDGREAQVPTWSQMLVEACKYALAHSPSVPLPFPDRAGRTRSLFSLVPLPPGISNVQVQHGQQTVYILTHYSANDCVGNALHALQLLPPSARAIELAVVFG